MRCRIIRDDLEVSGADPQQMEGQVTVKRIRRNAKMVDRLFWKVGAILSHPQAPLMVRLGNAEPADEECREAAGMTVEGLAAAQYARERLARGIHPEDFAAYGSGYLSGYAVNPDTGEQEWVPGPNGGRKEFLAAFGLSDDDDEDDDDD